LEQIEPAIGESVVDTENDPVIEEAGEAQQEYRATAGLQPGA
jgi:hypothetical protein